MRVENDRPTKNGGWLHILRDDGPLWAPWKRTVHVAAKQLQPSATLADIRAEHGWRGYFRACRASGEVVIGVSNSIT